ncbi:MAG TPA: prephenate dehydratase, partial [Gammaproteobacteria bacterium]|nr:prephenate dehydratase [Gammaproteobacteria bacterium]
LIDIEGHQQDQHLKTALEKVADRVLKVEILGSYPVAVL